MSDAPNKPKIALIVSGGGARAAYQVGVLKAVADILPADAPNPFQIICGTSAGALNAAALAMYAHNFRQAVRRLLRVWQNFHVDHVFRADTLGILANSARWWAALLFGGLGRNNPSALFDRRPLADLLQRYLPFEKIQESIDAGHLYALGITASGYGSGESVTFFQAADGVADWKRARRVGCRTTINRDHLLASSAIPFVFEAVKIHREYFGDGSMRQFAPLSPALHLGADRLLVIGVRQGISGRSARPENTAAYPSLAQMGGHVLNSIFLDALEVDIERLERVNEVLRVMPSLRSLEGGMKLRPTQILQIAPTRDLREIAELHKHHFPRPIKFLLRGIGAYRRGGSELITYLLFEKPYCRELIELGYRDAMARKDDIVKFFAVEAEN
jgi:NTE family protein